jgi:hypothetical protein
VAGAPALRGTGADLFPDDDVIGTRQHHQHQGGVGDAADDFPAPERSVSVGAGGRRLGDEVQVAAQDAVDDRVEAWRSRPARSPGPARRRRQPPLWGRAARCRSRLWRLTAAGGGMTARLARSVAAARPLPASRSSPELFCFCSGHHAVPQQHRTGARAREGHAEDKEQHAVYGRSRGSSSGGEPPSQHSAVRAGTPLARTPGRMAWASDVPAGVRRRRARSGSEATSWAASAGVDRPQTSAPPFADASDLR